MSVHIIAVIIGFIMDLCFGDPHWLPHPVRAIGWLITKLDKGLRGMAKGNTGMRLAGVGMTLCVLAVTGGLAGGVIYLSWLIHPYLRLVVESIMCYQLLAAKSLKDESMKVYHELKHQNVEAARTAVSMIVGRDTKALTDIGITKAAVETVAENTSDGVIAPLFYMMLGGGVGGFLYKAVNTMDSMVGYKHGTYLYFGWASAKLDDLLNLIPARLAAILMICSSCLIGLDGRNAVRIYKRDRHNHKSPNSAHTEAVCAGALDIQLAGDAYYFGKLHKKPAIGDAIRQVEYQDIPRANRLLYGTAVLGILFMAAVAWCIGNLGMKI